jgi:tetratricopeptide (TPR) repeat protein
MDSVLPLLASLAIALPARGEWLGAAMLLEAPAEAFPRDRSLQVERAWYLLRAGEGEKAEQAYRAALALNPRSLDAQLGLVDALMAQGRYRQASSTAVEFLAGRPGEVGLLHSPSVDPGNADATAGLGWIAWKRGETPVARERFGEALRQDPENAAALAGVATLPPETLWVPQAYVSLEAFDSNGTTTAILGGALHLRAFADLFASATHSAYSAGDSTQLDLGATIPVSGYASYELEELSGSIATATGQRFTLGLIGTF